VAEAVWRPLAIGATVATGVHAGERASVAQNRCSASPVA
jgi:hypothetical protein